MTRSICQCGRGGNQAVEFDPSPGLHAWVNSSSKKLYVFGCLHGVGIFRGQNALSLAGHVARAPGWSEYAMAFEPRREGQRAGSGRQLSQAQYRQTKTVTSLAGCHLISIPPKSASAGPQAFAQAKAGTAAPVFLKVEFDRSSSPRDEQHTWLWDAGRAAAIY